MKLYGKQNIVNGMFGFWRGRLIVYCLGNVGYYRSMDQVHITDYGIFEWNRDKAIVNLSKHKLDFYDAVAVFLDSHAVLSYDPLHSEDEERFKLVGVIKGSRLAAVFFTERNNIVRIISARKATNKEVAEYERKIADRLGRF